MLYTNFNTKKPRIFDVDSMEEIKRVMEINTKAGWLKVLHKPLRLDGKSNVIGDRIRFRSIYAISGDEGMPCLFHCYGRVK